jgi:hypothetical protein
MSLYGSHSRLATLDGGERSFQELSFRPTGSRKPADWVARATK